MSSISELKQEIGFRKYTEWKRDRITNDEICNLVKNFSRITCLLNCCMWKCQTNIVAIQRIRNSAAHFQGEIMERLRGASESDADCGWKAHLVDHIVSVRRVMRMQTNLCGNSC